MMSIHTSKAKTPKTKALTTADGERLRTDPIIKRKTVTPTQLEILVKELKTTMSGVIMTQRARRRRAMEVGRGMTVGETSLDKISATILDSIPVILEILIQVTGTRIMGQTQTRITRMATQVLLSERSARVVE